MKKRSMLLAALLLLTGCTAGCAQEKLPQNNAADIVYLGYKDIDTVCDAEEIAMAGRDLLQTMQDRDALLMSYAMDTAIEILPEELGEYDHFVLVSRTWLKAFAPENELVPVDVKGLPPEMQAFLKDQMSILTYDGSMVPAGATLCTIKKDALLCLPAYAHMNKPVMSHKPLIMVFDDPAAAMKADGFLLPLTSTANIVFSDAEALQAAAEKSPINAYISGIYRPENISR